MRSEGANAPCNRRRMPLKSPNVTPPSPPAPTKENVVLGWDRRRQSAKLINPDASPPTPTTTCAVVIPITEDQTIPTAARICAYNVLDAPYEATNGPKRKAAHFDVGRLLSLGVVGNWPRKGVMPMKWLGVRPDTSKPPTRRITFVTRRSGLPLPSKTPTRRITTSPMTSTSSSPSRPPTRRITS